MKYISDVLKQFSKDQKIFVLIVILIFMSGTYIVSEYIKSPQSNCKELIEINKRYIRDFIEISKMIKEERMWDVVGVMSDSVRVVGGNEMVKMEEDVLDRILKISDKEIK